jgi:glycine hydroxymethyltransferase
MNTIAAIAVTLKKAMEPGFREYGAQVLRNAKALAAALMDNGAALVTGGTDNHMMVLDCVSSFGFDGKHAEQVLDSVLITTNKQVIPDDPRPPLVPSGIRIGTPAATTRGMKEPEMQRLGKWMTDALKSHEDATALAAIRDEVQRMCIRFPVPAIS